MVTRKAVAFLLSDFQTPVIARELSVTARRHDLIAVPIVDPAEEALPNVGRVWLEDAESGELLEINTADKSVRAAYENAVEKHRSEWRREFRRRRIDAISLRTNEDYVPALRNFFRARERRLIVA